MLHDLCSERLEADLTVASVSPSQLFPCDAVLFAIVVVCTPIHTDRL